MHAAVKPRCWTDQQEQIDGVTEELSIIRQARENLRATLTMTNVTNFLLSCLLAYIIDESGLVIPSQLLETIVPELWVTVWIQILVMA